jgi:hypothetical protein
MTPEDEVWKPIPGYARHYEVSNYGRVRKLGRWSDGLNTYEYRLLALDDTHDGYFRIGIGAGRHRKRLPVHRFVLLAFLGPSELKVNHKDGQKRNNHLPNLEYVTNRENALHSYYVLGQQPMRGSSHGSSKLTETDVIEMRRLRRDGATLKELMSKFNITAGAISGICQHRTWKHTLQPGEHPLKPHTIMPH